MDLFQINNYKIDIKPEVLLIPVFNNILKRDKSKTKEMALKELSYIVFMCDIRSPYSNILSDEEKSKEIINDIFSSDWKPDKYIDEAILYYKDKEETITSKYFNSLKVGLSKVDKFITDFDVTPDTTPSEMTQINNMIRNSLETVKAIREVEKLIKEDKLSVNLLRGGREKGDYMDDD